jgi:RNA polymerase-binding transcription factor
MGVDLEHFRAVLLEERERVDHAIASLQDDHRGSLEDEVDEVSGTNDQDLAQTATATLDREIDYTLEENSTQVLGEIDAALLRIDAGTYGTCMNCAEEIPAARLEAYPWASVCVDCARKLERG